MTLHLLVAESEPPAARAKRRDSVGRSNGETFVALLARLAPGAAIDRVTPGDTDAALPPGAALAEIDGVFLTGSPLHLYEDTPEARREIDFMRAVFAAGAPAFGSCAGLQVATVAAGGAVRPSRRGREAGFARRITPTEAGRSHPLLAGRPPAFDAPSVHADEVATLPERSTLLATNGVTKVQAAEIRCGPGVFWGCQYHPELALFEVAGALRRQADSLVEAGLVRGPADLDEHVRLIEALDAEPDRSDLAWRLGLDEQVTDARLRRTEIRNFLERLVRPTRAGRDRATLQPA